MRYDFAPMEGITDAAFRAIHHKHFPGVDRYFMPFLSPTIHRSLTPREQRELPLADSVPFCAVPQLIGKNPEDMLWAIQVCKDRGYSEVNLNLGCPSGTVFSKGKGSGMLRDPDALDRPLPYHPPQPDAPGAAGAAPCRQRSLLRRAPASREEPGGYALGDPSLQGSGLFGGQSESGLPLGDGVQQR